MAHVDFLLSFINVSFFNLVRESEKKYRSYFVPLLKHKVDSVRKRVSFLLINVIFPGSVKDILRRKHLSH